LGWFLSVRIDVFLVSQDRGTSRLVQTLNNWLQDPDLRAVLLQSSDCQPTLSVDVPFDGIAGRLLQHLAMRTQRIIHSRSPRAKTPTVLVAAANGQYH
jgi:hypothetical protein